MQRDIELRSRICRLKSLLYIDMLTICFGRRLAEKCSRDLGSQC